MVSKHTFCSSEENEQRLEETQGSIVSPILANVFLHELDLFMKTLKERFEAGERRRANPAYIRYSNKSRSLRQKWDRQEVRRFIAQTLKLTIAEEKSHIRHSKRGVIFVGYWIKTYSGNRIVKMKCSNRHTTRKSVSERLQLHIPKGRLQKFCTAKVLTNGNQRRPGEHCSNTPWRACFFSTFCMNFFLLSGENGCKKCYDP